jgi:hypothetical protein
MTRSLCNTEVVFRTVNSIWNFLFVNWDLYAFILVTDYWFLVGRICLKGSRILSSIRYPSRQVAPRPESGTQRGLSCFLFHPLRVCHCRLSSYHLLPSLLLTWLSSQAERLSRHHRKHHVILIWICRACLCFHNNYFCSFLSSRFMNSLIWGTSALWNSSLTSRDVCYPRGLSRGFGMISSLRICTEKSELQLSRVDSTHLPYMQVWVHTHLVPRLGPWRHRFSEGRVNVGLVSHWRVTADGELRCDETDLFPSA